jgi:hypothetical protein
MTLALSTHLRCHRCPAHSGSAKPGVVTLFARRAFKCTTVHVYAATQPSHDGLSASMSSRVVVEPLLGGSLLDLLLEALQRPPRALQSRLRKYGCPYRRSTHGLSCIADMIPCPSLRSYWTHVTKEHICVILGAGNSVISLAPPIGWLRNNDRADRSPSEVPAPVLSFQLLDEHLL